jgi:hypothetical protein
MGRQCTIIYIRKARARILFALLIFNDTFNCIPPPFLIFLIFLNFLPPPEDLVLKEETVKITLVLSKTSVDFFKQLAEQKHTAYQKMIRALLDKYVSHYK